MKVNKFNLSSCLDIIIILHMLQTYTKKKKHTYFHSIRLARFICWVFFLCKVFLRISTVSEEKKMISHETLLKN